MFVAQQCFGSWSHDKHLVLLSSFHYLFYPTRILDLRSYRLERQLKLNSDTRVYRYSITYQAYLNQIPFSPKTISA